jgi:hypothetical protein
MKKLSEMTKAELEGLTASDLFEMASEMRDDPIEDFDDEDCEPVYLAEVTCDILEVKDFRDYQFEKYWYTRKELKTELDTIESKMFKVAIPKGGTVVTYDGNLWLDDNFSEYDDAEIKPYLKNIRPPDPN